MTHPTLPAPYLEALDYVTRYLPKEYPTQPVLAGGALRDLLIPRPALTPKDYDVFVLCQPYPGPYHISQIWRNRWSKLFAYPELFLKIKTETSSGQGLREDIPRNTRIYIPNFHRRWRNPKPGLDIIFIDLETPEDLLNTFDIGICRVAYWHRNQDPTDPQWLIHDTFTTDLKDQCIRIHNNGTFDDEHIRKHAQRLQQYYPHFTIDDSYFIRRDVADALRNERLIGAF